MTGVTGFHPGGRQPSLSEVGCLPQRRPTPNPCTPATTSPAPAAVAASSLAPPTASIAHRPWSMVHRPLSSLASPRAVTLPCARPVRPVAPLLRARGGRPVHQPRPPHLPFPNLPPLSHTGKIDPVEAGPVSHGPGCACAAPKSSSNFSTLPRTTTGSVAPIWYNQEDGAGRAAPHAPRIEEG